jgi:hypothetical protein
MVTDERWEKICMWFRRTGAVSVNWVVEVEKYLRFELRYQETADYFLHVGKNNKKRNKTVT